MASTNAEHDDAYYEKLLARVDNTISDSRTRDRGDLPMNLQISNDHSISGVFFYFEGDALSLPHRFSLMLLSIVYVMFFSLCTAGTETRTKGFAGSWFLITLTWQPLNTLFRSASTHFISSFYSLQSSFIACYQLLASPTLPPWREELLIFKVS